MVFLPQSVLQHILRRVPLRHRLCNCALVSRSWAEAASEATQTLSIQLQLSSHAYHYLQYWSVPVAVRCLPWLLKHSSQLTSLKVQGFHRDYQPLQTTLELRSLVQLSLQGVNLQLSHGDQRGLFWHDCTGLTSLILHEVQVSEGLGVLAEITRLTSLKSLTLTRVLPMDNDGECIPGSMPGSMLQLPELNQLQITANAQMSDDSLRLLSTLTKLQHLVVEDYSGMLTAAGFTGLGALAECPRLLHLQVAIRCVQHADLLGTLPPLMHELTHLSLQQRCHMAMRSWEGVGAPAMDYFDVLTADSSSLQYLALDTFVLDHEAWHSMFPADRLLDKLTHLDARLCCSTAEHPHCVLDENDLLSMAACCPNLCHLNLLDRCDPDIHLGQVLQQLSDLTALHFTATDGDAAAALVVHSLPSLKELCLKVPDEMSDAGWRHLASLRHLAHLWARQRSPPDVGKQILDWLLSMDEEYNMDFTSSDNSSEHLSSEAEEEDEWGCSWLYTCDPSRSMTPEHMCGEDEAPECDGSEDDADFWEHNQGEEDWWWKNEYGINDDDDDDVGLGDDEDDEDDEDEEGEEGEDEQEGSDDGVSG